MGSPLRAHLDKRLQNEVLDLKFRQNYNIGPLSLSCMRNWSFKFEVCVISFSSFQNEQYKLFY